MSKPTTPMAAFNTLAETRAQAFLDFADAIDTMIPALTDEDRTRLMGEEGRVMFNLSTFMHRACDQTREKKFYRYRVFYADVWKTFGCGSIEQVRELAVRLKTAWADIIDITIHDNDDGNGAIAFVIHFRVL